MMHSRQAKANVRMVAVASPFPRGAACRGCCYVSLAVRIRAAVATVLEEMA